jgi:prepilin-type N-terminal cleavage/methylation domain-containing protein
MSATRSSSRKGFSLIELVIVVVIIGIIAAIAIPRLSRGASGAADSAVAGNLTVLRNAIDLYATEHGGTFPALATFEAQLTQFSDLGGGTSTAKTPAAIYGPYIRKLPTLPVGPLGYKNTNTMVDGSTGAPGSTAGAWFYNASTGEIKVNLADSEKDVSGKSYNAY